MTKGRIFCAALAAALVGACGNDAEQDAGASVEPGPTGMIESTTQGVDDTRGGASVDPGAPQPGGTVVTGPPSAGVGTAPNAPPAMTSPATEGDTTVRTVAPGH